MQYCLRLMMMVTTSLPELQATGVSSHFLSSAMLGSPADKSAVCEGYGVSVVVTSNMVLFFVALWKL